MRFANTEEAKEEEKNQTKSCSKIRTQVAAADKADAGRVGECERERERGRKKSKGSKNKDGGVCAQFAFDAIKSLHQLLRQWTTRRDVAR